MLTPQRWLMSTCHPPKIPTSWTLLKDRWNAKNNNPTRVFLAPMVFSETPHDLTWPRTWPPPHLSYAKMDSTTEEPKHKGVSEASSAASVLFPRRHTLAYMPTEVTSMSDFFLFSSNGPKTETVLLIFFLLFFFVFQVFELTQSWCPNCDFYHEVCAEKIRSYFIIRGYFWSGILHDAVDFLCNSTSVCRSVMPSCLASTVRPMDGKTCGWLSAKDPPRSFLHAN